MYGSKIDEIVKNYKYYSSVEDFKKDFIDFYSLLNKIDRAKRIIYLFVVLSVFVCFTLVMLKVFYSEFFAGYYVEVFGLIISILAVLLVVLVLHCCFMEDEAKKIVKNKISNISDNGFVEISIFDNQELFKNSGDYNLVKTCKELSKINMEFSKLFNDIISKRNGSLLFIDLISLGGDNLYRIAQIEMNDFNNREEVKNILKNINK